MALYLFYPTREDGLCETFQSVELDDDGRVATRALQVLDEHLSAATVVVYSGHRKVLTRARPRRELIQAFGGDGARAPPRSRSPERS